MKFKWVDKIEEKYKRPSVNARVEQGSFFTFKRDHPYIASVYASTPVKITRQWKSTLLENYCVMVAGKLVM